MLRRLDLLRLRLYESRGGRSHLAFEEQYYARIADRLGGIKR